jgi:hypothetical protein
MAEAARSLGYSTWPSLTTISVTIAKGLDETRGKTIKAIDS